MNMIDRHSPGSTRRLTLCADKGVDPAEFVADLHLAGGTLGLYRTDFVSESGTCMPALSRRQR